MFAEKQELLYVVSFIMGPQLQKLNGVVGCYGTIGASNKFIGNNCQGTIYSVLEMMGE